MILSAIIIGLLAILMQGVLVGYLATFVMTGYVAFIARLKYAYRKKKKP